MVKQMSHSEEESVFEGFDVAKIETATRSERWRQNISLWVIAPLRVTWNDIRTRVGLVLISLYALVGTIGVVIVDVPEQYEADPFTPAFQTIQYPLGTDVLGRGVLELTVHATPAMLKIMLAGGVFITVVGTVLGTLAGYKRGLTERVIITASDIVMTIPGLPLLIVLAMALQPRDPFVVGLLLGANRWAGLTRTLHSQVLSLRSESYVEAARLMDIGTAGIIKDDILPNIMPYVMISFMGNLIKVVYASVGLYFLGVLPFTALNWGVMVNQAYNKGALQNPDALMWLLTPIIAINGIAFGVTLFSQGMDRVFNPRVRARNADN